MPFEAAKGLLPLPAQGRRLLNFGDINGQGVPSKGILIETRLSGQVMSSCDCWVVYAGPMENFGNVLIVNAGAGYHFLLAGLAQIDVDLGQFVLAGEPVAIMQRAEQADGRPLLYVELRKDGQAIDPEPWWQKN